MEADTWVKLLVQESLVPQPGFATGEPDVLSPGIQKELQGTIYSEVLLKFITKNSLFFLLLKYCKRPEICMAWSQILLI